MFKWMPRPYVFKMNSVGNSTIRLRGINSTAHHKFGESKANVYSRAAISQK